MSLINDALNKAKQASPKTPPSSLPPMQPVANNNNDSPPAVMWLVPAIVIVLIIAAIFFIGWAAAHNTVHDAQVAQQPISATQQVESTSIDTILQDTNSKDTFVPGVLPPPPPPPPEPVYVPKLQGIFYSATEPTAILDGKTVSPGDSIRQYKVKTISKYTVILVDTNNQETTVGMDH